MGDRGMSDDVWMLPPLPMPAGVDSVVLSAPDAPTGLGYWLMQFPPSLQQLTAAVCVSTLSNASNHLGCCQNASCAWSRPWAG